MLLPPLVLGVSAKVTVGRVSVNTVCVALEHTHTGSRVVVAAYVGDERSSPGSRVVAAGCVAIERIYTSGGVEAANCVTG